MAALIIRIEETHDSDTEGQDMVGFAVYHSYDGELHVGDALPGMRPIIVRAVQRALDTVWGQPIAESRESVEDARKQALIN